MMTNRLLNAHQLVALHLVLCAAALTAVAVLATTGLSGFFGELFESDALLGNGGWTG